LIIVASESRLTRHVWVFDRVAWRLYPDGIPSGLSTPEPTVTRPKRAPEPPAKRESPVQFRPTGELCRLLDDFTSVHGMSRNEACRHLIALALVGLDARHYAVVREMAAGAMAGAFLQACLHLHAALLAAARLEGEPLVEPRRARFVVDTARDALAAKNLGLTADCSAFLPRDLPPQVGHQDFGPVRRKVKAKLSPEDGEVSGAVRGESALGSSPEQVNEGSVPQRVDG